MNFTDMKVNSVNIVNVTDSLNSALLRIKVSTNVNTVMPIDNNLIIYVDKSNFITADRKEYVLNLQNKLNYLNNETDEFIMEPKIINNEVKMIAYINRKIANNTLLANMEVEELEYQEITLFDGTNYIYTNYENALIEIIYPKNSDLMKYFLNNSIFNKHDNNQKEFSLEDIYFKDCFTKTTSGINIEANNLDINCLTSQNNKFSLDSDGNLTVNSISAISNSNMGISVNDIYPVGSIYMNVNQTSPEILFGGTWERIQDTFLLASGSTYENNLTGGSATHTLTVDEMPRHNHNFQGGNGFGTSADLGKSGSAYPAKAGYNMGSAYYSQGYIVISYNGNGVAHNNMPPYLTVYMWKRTA